MLHTILVLKTNSATNAVTLVTTFQFSELSELDTTVKQARDFIKTNGSLNESWMILSLMELVDITKALNIIPVDGKLIE